MKTNDPLVCSPNSDERIFKKVTAYIRTAPINAYHQESIRRDIVRMLLDAQSHGQTARRCHRRRLPCLL